MAKLLVNNKRRWLWLGTILTIMALVTILIATTVYAGTYYGKFTGYAMGNRYGASNKELTQGDFANHSSVYCPNDPAAYWSYGTHIFTPDIPQHTELGYPVNYGDFYLYDIGDPTCSQGSYWVDVYFGRWRSSSDTCDCPGSPSPGYCIVASANSCTDATGFGYEYYTYTGP